MQHNSSALGSTTPRQRHRPRLSYGQPPSPVVAKNVEFSTPKPCKYPCMYGGWSECVSIQQPAQKKTAITTSVWGVLAVGAYLSILCCTWDSWGARSWQSPQPASPEAYLTQAELFATGRQGRPRRLFPSVVFLGPPENSKNLFADAIKDLPLPELTAASASTSSTHCDEPAPRNGINHLSVSSKGEEEAECVMWKFEQTRPEVEADDDDQEWRRSARTRPSAGCELPEWTARPACNCMHELPDRDGWYLGGGHFRDAFLLKEFSRFEPDGDTAGDLVMKRLRLAYYMNWKEDNVERVQREAFLMEQLQPSLVINEIYGFCGTSTAVASAKELGSTVVPFLSEHQSEEGRIATEALRDWQRENRSTSLNALTPEQKLGMALQMAESMAELAGFERGVVVNNDLGLDQWLLSQDGRVVLNDLNYSFFLPFHWKSQTYCRVFRSIGGTFRAPEEREGGFVDERLDVWPFGDVIFCLLTGLYPYYDIESRYRARIEQKVLDGERPYIDPAIAQNSFIEGELVKIMDLCHTRDLDTRISFFEVVDLLRETQRLYRAASVTI